MKPTNGSGGTRRLQRSEAEGQAGPTLEAIDNEVGPVGLEPTINAV